MTSKRKCEDCGERIDICRELGGCQAEADRYEELRSIDEDRRVDAYIDERRGA